MAKSKAQTQQTSVSNYTIYQINSKSKFVHNFDRKEWPYFAGSKILVY